MTEAVATDAEKLAKQIWLAEFQRAFDRAPTDPWENQSDSAKATHIYKARKLIEAGWQLGRPAPRPADGVPERETFWLLERSDGKAWALYTSSGGVFMHSYTEDVWQAGRFQNERHAHDVWRSLDKDERERWKPVEHIFINKVQALTAPVPTAGGGPVAWRWRSIFNTDHWCFDAKKPSFDNDQYIAEPLYATPTASAERAKVVEALEVAEKAFESIRLKLINHLEEPERSAFWLAVRARDFVRAALSPAAGTKP